MKLVHWPLMGGLLHLVQRGGAWAGPQRAQALLAVPITVLLYNGPLLCAINVPIKGLYILMYCMKQISDKTFLQLASTTADCHLVLSTSLRTPIQN